MMNREQRRASAKHLKKVNKDYGDALKEVPREEWPIDAPEIQRVLRSNRFLVQEHLPKRADVAMVLCRLSVMRTEIAGRNPQSRAGTVAWKDGITWEELQAIKAECGYASLDAVEVYPRNVDVVKAYDQRHLWILRGLLPFAWRAE